MVGWVAALALRLREATSQGMWPDEFLTLWAAHGDSLSETARRTLAQHPQSPCYYVVVHIFLAVFGDSELGARLPSLVAGAALPVVIYLAIARTWGRRAGAAAFLLVCVNPLFVLHAAEARPYALAELGAALSLLGLSRLHGRAWVRDRVLAWGGALLAVYAHYVFAPVAVALVAGIMASGRRAYSLKTGALDGAITAALFAPGAIHMLKVFGRRSDLTWKTLGPGASEVLIGLVPGAPIVLLLGASAVVVLAIRGRLDRLGVSRRGRGILAWTAVSVLLHTGLLGLLWLGGSNLMSGRYLVPTCVGLILLLAYGIRGLPVLPALLGLGLLCGWGVREVAPPPSTGWREVAAELDSLEPALDEPILLWQGLNEANLLVRGEPTLDLRGWLSSPLADRPGRPRLDPQRLVLLPSNWGEGVLPGHDRYLRDQVSPAIAKSKRFFVVGHAGYQALLREWIAKTVPGFQCTYASERPYRGFLVVTRYDRVQ